MPQEHIVKSYDEDLNILNQHIFQMGKSVENLLVDAVTSLTTNNVDLANEVILRDKKIDAMQHEIDQQATKMLALRQPMAADLRAIIAAIRISNDLERMGDYAKNISKRAKTLSQSPFLRAPSRSIGRLSQLVEEMISETMEVYLVRDADRAKAVILRDEDVDELHTAQFREILTYMMEDTRNISALTHYLFITKNIERIGDHATNIAEQIYYVATGKQLEDIHSNFDGSSALLSDI